MKSEILWAYFVGENGDVLSSPLIATDHPWPMSADDWFSLLTILGVDVSYRRLQINPRDWEHAVFWKKWLYPSVCQKSMEVDWLLSQLATDKQLPLHLVNLRDLARTELKEVARRGLQLLVSIGPASSWNPHLPLYGDGASFTQVEIEAMVGRVRGRIEERIARRIACDAAGICAIDDPLMLARRREEGFDDEQIYRAELDKFEYGGERIEFLYVLSIRANPRRMGRTEMWLQVGMAYRNTERRQSHQIWVLHHDDEWYRVGG